MNLPSRAPGVLFVTSLAVAATFASRLEPVEALRLSPLIVGILIGVLLGNSLSERLPDSFHDGITFCTKQVLRTAIVLYGFRITFTEIAALGANGLLLDVLMVSTTLCLGAFMGTRVFKIDRSARVFQARPISPFTVFSGLAPSF